MTGATARKHHLLISGTGRAGTSFLVCYLTALGLDTTLSRNGAAYWDEHAEAGLEQMPFVSGDVDLPYVVKSPTAAEVVEKVVADGTIHVDAIILPMRRMSEAAASRCALEARAIHQHLGWRAELDRPIAFNGTVPGGILYSLHPLDQARVLAVCFHDLIMEAAAAEIPMVFPTFPRLVEDWAYLWRTLRHVLPPDITKAMAEAAHAQVAQVSKVRIGGELAQRAETDDSAGIPSLVEADNIGLRREIRRLRKELEEAKASGEHS